MGNSTQKAVYAYPVENTKKEGETPAYRNIICKTNYNGELVNRYPAWPEVTTLYESLLRGVRKFPRNPCFGVRKLLPDGKTRGEYVWESYESVYRRVLDFVSGLKALGFKRDTKIGLYSINRPEWLIASHACAATSMVSVPLYDTLGPQAVSYIINQAEIPVVVCSADKLDKVLDPSIKCPTLKYIICMDPLPEGKSAEGITIMTFDELLKLGHEKKLGLEDSDKPKPDDLATICYTSGTTGDPKGVMLTHSNFIATISGALCAGIDLNENDVYISYLPLAHMYERIMIEASLACGTAIGFYSGDVLKLLDDIAALKPTIFPSVPRLYNRIYDKIMQAVGQLTGLKHTLFEAGLNSKKEKLAKGETTSFFWDSLVFGKTKERLGGRQRLCFSGAAPLQPEVHDFLKIVMCCPVLQGYGLSETCAATHVQAVGDTSSGNVGAPLCCSEFKLVDVPDMNYFTTDNPPRGEVVLRGGNIFKGYYKMEDKTAEVLTADGWFYTGDIGQINPNGTLSIIDRKKNIFKLSQGEYVAAEKIEITYATSPFIQQIFVYGDSTQNVLVAIVVPDPDVLKDWAKANNIPNADDINALCANEQVRQQVLNDMNRVGKNAQLRGFEFVKNIYLEPSPFSIEKDLLTPTFKLKRPQLKNYYSKVIADLYKEYNSKPQEERAQSSAASTNASTAASTAVASAAASAAEPSKVEAKEEPKAQQTTEEPQKVEQQQEKEEVKVEKETTTEQQEQKEVVAEQKEVEQKEEIVEQKQEVVEQKEEVAEQKEVVEQKEEVVEQKEEVAEKKEEALEQKEVNVEQKEEKETTEQQEQKEETADVAESSQAEENTSAPSGDDATN